MKDNRTENERATANDAVAEQGEEIAAGLKKFKDVQALIDAYTALEAEFTRRSQRLKELEASKEQQPVQTASEVVPSQCAAEERCESRKLSQEEKNAVIEEYLSGVCANKGVPFVTAGGAVRAERNTPKTLSEAGMLAKRYFENKEDK